MRKKVLQKREGLERFGFEAEAEVVDLCETACDVAADVLGLSDDEALAFEGSLFKAGAGCV